MIPMPIAGRPLEARDQYIRSKRTNDPHDIGHGYIIAVPLLKSLFLALREPEIRYPREPLFCTVIAVRCSQFQSAQYAEHIEQVASDFVLATLAAVQRQQQHGVALAPRFQ